MIGPKGARKAITGGRGERAAAWHAWLRGARILARNASFRCGELDLVLWDRGTLAFGEVKARAAGEEAALAAVGWTKQRRLLRAARAWLREARIDPLSVPCRFDVFLVAPGWLGWPRVTWLRNAFEADLLS